jgi:hypothetical protein
MSYLTTGLDLKQDALFIGGEPTDGTSQYDAPNGPIYEWLTVVERTIVSGGMFGPSYLEPADWYWARAWPRGAIQLVQPFNQAGAIAATFVSGSTTVTLGTATTTDLTGYRLLKTDTPARHIITTNSGTSITLREPWSGDSETNAADWLAYPDTYLLPQDFVRGTSPLFLYGFPSNLPTTQTVDVVDPVDLERMYPQCFPWAQGTQTVGGGLPVMAARVTTSRIRFSHFLNTPNTANPIQLEFEYIRRPDVIAEGTIPTIPVEHRRCLSYGAAYLILDDKADSEAGAKYQMFVSQYKAMRDEHARDMRRMSSRWGVIQPPRSSGNRSITLTESGLPVYIW